MNFSIQVAIETILDQIKDGNGRAAINIVVSPASLDILLRTAANGTKGKTLEQLLRFLGAEDIDDLNAQASKTMEVLRLASPENNPPVPERKPNRYSSYDFTKYEHVPANISCANAVWIDERYSAKDSFKKVLADVYRAETNPVDFLHQSDEALIEINSWVEKSTNGCVKKILTRDNIDGDTALVLTNAIYFKALWTSKFGESEGEKFYLLNGTNTVRVPFIRTRIKYFRYASFEEFKVLELPYQTGRPYGEGANGPCFSMYFLLPHEVGGLPAMLRKFKGSTEELSQTLGGLECVLVKKMAIPMWKSSYRFKAKETLQRMGLKMPFGKNGDFTEMLDNRDGKAVYISDVIQSGYINVDENGTEAGAASAVRLTCSSLGDPPVIPDNEFVADHPFMYMIVERDSKAVIFTGAVFNPLDGLQ